MRTLIHDIQSAFAGVALPLEDQLLHPDCMDDVDVQEFYGGIRREDMNSNMVVYSYAALNCFSPQAFRYYLPAYLMWTLNNADSIEYVGEATFVALDPGTEQEMLHEFRKSKFSHFDTEQFRVVSQFLQHFSDHQYFGELADQALLNYWMIRH